MMARLQHATNRLDAIAEPYERRLGPIQNRLTPLEGIGKQALAWLGCALIIIGLFIPIKTYPIAFVQLSYSYWDLNHFLTAIFLILAIAAIALVYLRMYVWLWLIGAFYLVFFLLGFINAFSGGGDISSDSGTISPHASYGWIFLFAGLLAMLAAAAMRDTRVRAGR
jgi:hypothetical protein